MDFLEYLKGVDARLFNKVEDAISVFDSLDKSKQYHLAFSGGKDSHALLICFLLFQERYGKQDNFQILFADTLLEENVLYELIEKIKTVTGCHLTIVKPEKTYWYFQFAIGYPVPSHFIRWCTGNLKIKPMEKSGTIAITGRHFGESAKRDASLLKTSCSSGERGVDKIKKSIDPIANFSNCDVWDLIFYADNAILYDGVFNALKTIYAGNEGSKGSLRMGCIMCPVISVNSIKKRNPDGYILRQILEKLRNSPRINSPRTGKKGAIYIESRRKVWSEIEPIILRMGLISIEESEEIVSMLKKGVYPKTYSDEHIQSEHLRLAKIINHSGELFYDLPLFQRN